jgi:(S)-2-hydroxyglutarate dehydrogenase
MSLNRFLKIKMVKRVAILGSGIIGLSIAYKLLKLNNQISLTIIEKEDEVGKHQSGRNSGVLHCGLYYETGSLKAKLAVEGIREMTDFCKTYNIDHDICGKVVVASNERETEFLDKLYNRGIQNGLKGLVFLDEKELKQREPYVKAYKALLVPEEGIVDFKAVMQKLLDEVKSMGCDIFFNSKVTSAGFNDNKVVLKTNQGIKSFDLVINCTGLQSDRVYTQLTAKKRPFRIVPFRGEYFELRQNSKRLVNHLVYPVPDPNYPFLGVHFTRMINGSREVGPNAVLAFKREGYRLEDFSLRDVFDSFFYKGLLNFLRKNFLFSFGEFKSSISKNEFLKKAQKLIPSITKDDIVKGSAGVRAQAMSEQGDLIMDFKIECENNQIHVLNAPSPGATASLAIASYIIDNYIKNQFCLECN